MAVKIYSTPTCIWCKKAKEFLKENNVSFKEIDVSSDKKAYDEMVKISSQNGTPVIDINGKIIIGFDEDKIKGALNLS